MDCGQATKKAMQWAFHGRSATMFRSRQTSAGHFSRIMVGLCRAGTKNSGANLGARLQAAAERGFKGNRVVTELPVGVVAGEGPRICPHDTTHTFALKRTCYLLARIV
jgi:hypothetical protein